VGERRQRNVTGAKYEMSSLPPLPQTSGRIVTELLRVAAAEAQDPQLALVLDGGDTLSRAEVMRLSEELAAVLRSLSGEGGGRTAAVAIRLPPSALWVVTAVAALHAG
jgi:acyl-CoA synthetase (AMP-forming)/AMP-acid ligase II